MNNKLTCCGKQSIWVENVPGKGYNFCRECREEVTDRSGAVTIKSLDEELDVIPVKLSHSIIWAPIQTPQAAPGVAGGGRARGHSFVFSNVTCGWYCSACLLDAIKVKGTPCTGPITPNP